MDARQIIEMTGTGDFGAILTPMPTIGVRFKKKRRPPVRSKRTAQRDPASVVERLLGQG